MRILLLLLYTSTVFCSGIVFAARPDKLPSSMYLINESSKCVAYFAKFEKKYHIPKDLIHSISLQESGRHHQDFKKAIPWPWAVNVEGQGYYFDRKLDAVNFVIQQQNKGKKSIDVGCMQISLLYHGSEFKSIADAFEPKRNVEYGAIFLREKFEQYKSWKKAVANYHSSDITKGTKYQESVLKIANNINQHKFHTQKYRGFTTPSNKLYASRYKPLVSKSRYNADKNRYKANMMVFLADDK